MIRAMGEDAGNPAAIDDAGQPAPSAGHDPAREALPARRPGTATGRQPSVRTVHHLACTGGTIISRCLAAMPNTRLLSEVDPLSPAELSPGLFCPTDLIRLVRLGSRPAGPALLVHMFQAGLRVLLEDSYRSGFDLVLRDHAHGHFCVGPVLAQRPALRDMVAALAPVRSLVTVRHPFDSFLALRRNEWVHFTPGTPDEYARRYHAFLDHHAGIPVMRYEDFTADPDGWLRRATALLDLAFDPIYRDLITMIRLSGDSGRSGDEIAPRPRRMFPEALCEEVANSAAFTALLDRLGYDPVGERP
jgi:hypothetical protein